MGLLKIYRNTCKIVALPYVCLLFIIILIVLNFCVLVCYLIQTVNYFYDEVSSLMLSKPHYNESAATTNNIHKTLIYRLEDFASMWPQTFASLEFSLWYV